MATVAEKVMAASRHKKEPQAVYLPGVLQGCCLNLGFWAGRHGVSGDGNAAQTGLIEEQIVTYVSFSIRHR
jgi:hypothetical protein